MVIIVVAVAAAAVTVNMLAGFLVPLAYVLDGYTYQRGLECAPMRELPVLREWVQIGSILHVIALTPLALIDRRKPFAACLVAVLLVSALTLAVFVPLTPR